MEWRDAILQIIQAETLGEGVTRKGGIPTVELVRALAQPAIEVIHHLEALRAEGRIELVDLGFIEGRHLCVWQSTSQPVPELPPEPPQDFAPLPVDEPRRCTALRRYRGWRDPIRCDRPEHADRAHKNDAYDKRWIEGQNDYKRRLQADQRWHSVYNARIGR